jgi:hypothetical protein
MSRNKNGPDTSGPSCSKDALPSPQTVGRTWSQFSLGVTAVAPREPTAGSGLTPSAAAHARLRDLGSR